MGHILCISMTASSLQFPSPTVHLGVELSNTLPTDLLRGSRLAHYVTLHSLPPCQPLFVSQGGSHTSWRLVQDEINSNLMH